MCVTCDYTLYRFDWETARQRDQLPCTVLPHQFLQILRPYVPASSDFDRTFAETFAIPEFRTIDSRAALAASKMLALLATYKGMTEETAASMLANDLLLDALKDAKDDEDFEAQVEAAIVTENVNLLEEKKALEEELTEEKAKQAEKERDREATLRQLSAEREQREAALDLAEKRAGEAEREASRLKRKASILETLAGILLAVGAAAGVEFFADTLQWTWLLQHQNSYAMRAVAYLAILLFFVGLLRRQWRPWTWGSSGVVTLFAFLTLLGGPGKP